MHVEDHEVHVGQKDEDIERGGSNNGSDDEGEQGLEEEEEEDTSWDNGEFLTTEECAKIMKLDVFSRAQEMKHR